MDINTLSRNTVRIFAMALGLFSMQVSGNAFADKALAASNNEGLPHSVLRLPNIHPGRDPVYAYAKTLLYNALKITESEYGTFELLISQSEVVQERQLRSLEHNLLDITWSVTSRERESLHKAIRIPIMAGLFGKRIMLIRKNDERFNSPLSFSELTTMRAVQGYDWPDTRIFLHNNIPVLETTYRASFRIVGEGFADMFPRSVMEIQNEVDIGDAKGKLDIEPNVLVSYPSPLFFFVSSDREILAERIATGLLMLLETTDFQQLLFKQDIYQKSLALMEGRTVIELENPLLSEQSQAALDKYLPYFDSADNKNLVHP